MYLTKGGGGGKRDLKKKHAISNQNHRRYGMEYVSKKKKKQGNYCALPHKLMGEGCNSIKMGLRGTLVCYFVKIETVFG